ncbi:MAG: preprotein translocase subunit SecG [Candidatus Omnitrophota bacterium]
MFGFLIFLHVIIAILLIAAILLQSGRSSGLTESFSSAAESIFGTKTNTFMVRTTAVLSTLFIINCLVLAYISKQESKSLMEKVKINTQSKESAPEEAKPAPGNEQKEVSPAVKEEIAVRQNEVKAIVTNEITEQPK